MKRIIDKIICHHSAVDQPNLNKAIASFDKTHKERLHEFRNWLGYHIAYHYLIAENGEIAQTRPLQEIWFHASDFQVNKSSIWVCFIGNFDKHPPTEKQYEACRRLVQDIMKDHDISIHFHNEYAPKTCPGRNFDYNRVRSFINKEVIMPTTPVDPVEKTKAIKELIESNSQTRTKANNTLKYCNEETREKIDLLKKTLKDTNDYFRTFWY